MLLDAALRDISEQVYEKMNDLLPSEKKGGHGERRLAEAMRYATLSGGKRLRPFLVVCSADLFGVSRTSSLQVASAIEFIHAYSLIHDDLPAMDDDDERRGQPSTHKKFDEATAILSGDALLTYAFEVLSHHTTHPDPGVRTELISAYAKASGVNGMAGGQMLDLISETKNLNIEEITHLQRMKTGALFGISCESGAILGKASQPLRNALRGYANNIGLAFQIVDDLLDAEVGKKGSNPKRKDKSSEKGTFVKALGVEKARRQAQMLTEQAVAYLDVFDKRAQVLKELARFVVERKH